MELYRFNLSHSISFGNIPIFDIFSGSQILKAINTQL